MSPARRGQPEGEPSTRDALMDAALEQLRSKGALAGLNLQEVADAVGVTPANIYYHFGGRQGLLRAAITRELARLSGPLAQVEGTSFVERRGRMFEAILAVPEARLSALLALDGDPDYEPLPFLERSRESWRHQVASGELPEDVDAEAVHLVSVAAAIGVSIYAESAARQMGVDVEDLTARARAVVVAMVEGAVGGAGAASETSGPGGAEPPLRP